MTDLAVLGYAADDVGSVMAALLDNATRYSPGTVTVSGHLLEDGGIMFRIEDTGIGLGADQVAALNAAFAGPVPDVDERTGRHTGFPVVHRIARKHSIGVRLAARPLPSSGTVAMVTLPPHLLCEVPGGRGTSARPAPASGTPAQPAASPAAERGPRPAARRADAAAPDAAVGAARSCPTATRTAPGRGAAPPGAGQPARRRAAAPAAGAAAAPTPEQQSAARRAFADDLSAFSLGTGSQGTGDPPDPAGDTATEEEAKP